jgi:polysaccharide biosynthesis protein VpsQ
MQSKFVQIAAISFFGFILWIIYLANTGGSSIFFELIRGIPYGDKLRHFGLYGVLTLLFNMASGFKSFTLLSYAKSGLRYQKIHCYWGTLLVTSFAVIEEISQGWIDNRTLDSQDLLADFVGISCFTLISFWISKTKTMVNRSV